MSETTSPSDEESTVTKRVTIVGYFNDQEGSLREVGNSVVEEDMFKQKEMNDSSYYIQGGDVKISLSQDEYYSLEDVNSGDIEVVEEVETNNEYVNYVGKPSKRIVSNFFDDVVEEELPEGYNTRWGNEITRGNRFDGEKVVKMQGYVKETPMLVHPSEMTPDNFVEDEDEMYNAVKIKVTISKVSEDEMEILNSIVNEMFAQYLSDVDELGRVRWTDCKKQKTEQYVCFNI